MGLHRWPDDTGAVIDFHSHVLPGIDDGSQTVEESLRMLSSSAEQGVAFMAATPHFYPSQTRLEQFLDRRKRAAEQLRAAWRPEFPGLLLGAEVYYFEGISRAGALDALRIERTPLLLLEMPLCAWPERMLSEIKALQTRPDFTIALAHIERYLRFQTRAVWDELLEAGVLMQSNAEFFRRWKSRRKATRMFDAGRIHLLGSDCHNMGNRPPCMDEALSVIGEQRTRELARRCRELLKLEEAIL